jgi:hypothetical protein
MAIAMDSVWDETMEALKGMADPMAVQATLVSAMAMYMLLWVLPEPVSKGLAASLTVAMMAYLGVDTVWSLIQGWKRLVEEADRARTFTELREAGERFSKVMGQNSTRAVVMLLTAAIGNTAGLAVKAPGLPGAARAAVVAEAEAGVLYSAVAQVETVTLGAGGFTLGLAPNAVAMASRGMDGNRHSVYISRDPEGQVQYVGITNDIARRTADQFRLKGIRIAKLMDKLSREDARAVEQALIEIHDLERSGGTLVNRINSVARTNPKYAAMLRRGKELLESIGYKGD